MPLAVLALALVVLGGCVSLPADEGAAPHVVAAAPDPKAPRLSPLDTRTVAPVAASRRNASSVSEPATRGAVKTE